MSASAMRATRSVKSSTNSEPRWRPCPANWHSCAPWRHCCSAVWRSERSPPAQRCASRVETFAAGVGRLAQRLDRRRSGGRRCGLLHESPVTRSGPPIRARSVLAGSAGRNRRHPEPRRPASAFPRAAGRRSTAWSLVRHGGDRRRGSQNVAPRSRLALPSKLSSQRSLKSRIRVRLPAASLTR